MERTKAFHLANNGNPFTSIVQKIVWTNKWFSRTQFTRIRNVICIWWLWSNDSSGWALQTMLMVLVTCCICNQSYFFEMKASFCMSAEEWVDTLSLDSELRWRLWKCGYGQNDVAALIRHHLSASFSFSSTCLHVFTLVSVAWSSITMLKCFLFGS